MEIECRFFATFREAVGEKTLIRELEKGTTVGELLADLEAEYDDLEGQLLDENGEIVDMLSILKNGRNVVHASGVDTPLEDGDEVSVFPPVAGGSEHREERSFRGISARLAVEYLEGLGGEEVPVDEQGKRGSSDVRIVEGDGWRAELTARTVEIGRSLALTEVTITFEGDPDALETMIQAFERKAMRAGG